jgi:RNA polymerase sigma-70 factor (ECF subfamily)
VDESQRTRLPAMADATDELLASRAAEGDERAFEVIVRRHGSLMRAYAARILGGATDADDVVQTAFITAWNKLPELADGAALKAWLMRITSHAAIDRIRARKDHGVLEDYDAPTPESKSPAVLAENRSQLDALSGALEKLPQIQRQCWIMREVGGESYDEIAQHLGVPLSTVRGALSRARTGLMTEMEAWR